MKKVLLTGASGFIGRHAIAPLLDRGFEIHCVTSKAAPPVPGVTWHVADLMDSSATHALIQSLRSSHLLHFAWYAEPGKFWSSPENKRWLSASELLLRAFAEGGGTRAVMAGTCAEYEWRDVLSIAEKMPLNPATLYGQCKNKMRQTLAEFSQARALSSAWGRVFWLYGPHEHPARFVPAVIRPLLKGEPARCTHGNQIRDFLHVQDVASAFAALLDSDVQGAVNIASGQPVQLKNIVFTIAEKLNAHQHVLLDAIAVPADEPPRVVADVSRLQSEVKWQPRRTLSAGLLETIEWWRGN